MSQPVGTLTLEATDLHVWSALLDQPEVIVRRLRETLSPDEQVRAARYHFERDRRRFIIARGVLRSISGVYLNTPPNELAFEYGVRGKPALSPVPDGKPLCFNMSHSHELALYVFARHSRLGVDVEYALRDVNDADQLAERFFSANENAAYRALPAGEKRTAFFRCWTRKEAYIKAIGEGLSQPLNRFDVSLALGQPPAILNIDGDPWAAQRWSIFHLEPETDYVGAIAIEGHSWQLTCWAWKRGMLSSES